VAGVVSLIFEDNFDNQPDWTSDSVLGGNVFSVPEGWTAGRADPRWSPATGYPDKHATAEVLASNSDKARGGTGKSYVGWRVSYDPGWKQFNSDSVIIKYFPEGYDEIYAEFWVTFSDEMAATYYNGTIGQSKLFRAYHFNGDMNEIFSYFGNVNKPAFSWDIAGETEYGVRNFHSYYTRGESDLRGIITDLPQYSGLQGGGDISLWYANSATDGMGVNGSNPSLTDYKNGGSITSGPVDIDQVFGGETQWVKMGFYMKMNSAPEVADGVLMQWINDERILSLHTIPWIRAGFDMVKWNTIGIGGNDFFRGFPNESLYQDWYAIDDLKVYNGIPDGQGLI